jgi:hypothetical protein
MLTDENVLVKTRPEFAAHRYPRRVEPLCLLGRGVEKVRNT